MAPSSPAFSTNPGRCVYEHIGVKAPGIEKKMTFLPAVLNFAAVDSFPESGADEATELRPPLCPSSRFNGVVS